MGDLKKAIGSRRSYYSISDKSPLSDDKIKQLVDYAVLNVPSGYNSQSARLVLLLGEHHKRLWEIVKEQLRVKAGEQAAEKATPKIEKSFKAGHGTILFFEDQAVVRGMQEKFPTYAANFPVWSEHTSAMHQYALWLMLEDAGFGASLQHYNPLIDDAVKAEWNLDAQWKLVAQMPFGEPLAEPGSKEFLPLEKRSLVFE